MAATVAIIYLAIIIFWMALTLNKYRFVARTTYCIYHLGETATYLKCIILITGKRDIIISSKSFFIEYFNTKFIYADKSTTCVTN
jgi:hypothetical protein